MGVYRDPDSVPSDSSDQNINTDQSVTAEQTMPTTPTQDTSSTSEGNSVLDIASKIFNPGMAMGKSFATAGQEAYNLGTQDTASLLARSAEKNNWIISLLHNGVGDWTKSNADFNPLNEISGTKYAAHAEFFANADNEDDMQVGREKVDEQEQYNELKTKAPTLAFWSDMAWGMADPVWAVPGLDFFKAATMAKSVAKGGAAVAGIVGLEETGLQASQPDRSIAESAVNVATSALIGGLTAGLLYRAGAPIVEESINALKGAEHVGTNETPKTYQAPDLKEATDGIKTTLGITSDEIPTPPIEASKANISNDSYESIMDRLDKHNMEGHVNDVNRVWEEAMPPEKILSVAEDKAAFLSRNQEDTALDSELAQVLNVPEPPKEGAEAFNLNADTQSISAGHVTYDVRVKGLPPVALKAIAVPHLVNTSIEGMADSSGVLRDFVTRVGYTHTPLVNAHGEQVTAPYSFESMVQADMVQALNFNKEMDSSFMRLLNVDPESFGHNTRAFIKSKGKNYLSRSQFDEAVMDALSAGGEHEVPEVKKAAQYTRNLLDRRWKDMQEVGLIEKDRAPFQNYFKVVWDIPHIISHRTQVEQDLSKVFMGRSHATVKFSDSKGIEKEVETYLDNDTKSLAWNPSPGESLISVKAGQQLNQADAINAASDAVDNILRLGDKNLELGDLDRLSFTRGTDSSKNRKIILSDKDYNLMKDHLVKNFTKVTHQYLASTSRAIAYKKMLDSLGVENLQDIRVRIKEEGLEKISKVQRNPSLTVAKKDKLIEKLNKQIISSEKKFNDIAAISLGQFKNTADSDAFFRTVNQYNVARMFGGIVLSSLGDPTMMLIKNSIPNTLWNGWFSELRRMGTLTNKLKSQDFRNAMTSIQNEMDDLTRFLLNPDMTTYGVGPKEKVAQVVSNMQMKSSGMILWNNFWQRASHSLAENNILGYISKSTKKGVSYLKEIGIDEDMGKRILDMQNKYGEDIRGTHISNSHMWSDQEAADRFNNALRTEVHKSPIITEMLDIPRYFGRSELRRSVLLGMGFNYAAVNKIVMSAASRRDLLTLQGIATLVMAGMAVKKVQDLKSGRKSDYSLSQWIFHGIDKSGVLGMLGDPLLQTTRAVQDTNKFGGRAWVKEPVDYLLGPNSSVINPVYHAIISKLAGQNLDRKTAYQLKALIPFHNLWWLNLVHDKYFGKGK